MGVKHVKINQCDGTLIEWRKRNSQLTQKYPFDKIQQTFMTKTLKILRIEKISLHLIKGIYKHTHI